VVAGVVVVLDEGADLGLSAVSANETD
jgi:hypothetical protein